ncbi:hypothetical protein ACNOYE_09410 [Nannocystaceae bacterium ST9]
MSFVDEIKDFAHKRAVELKAISKAELTLDAVQVAVAGQSLEFRVDVERRAAWNLYIELATRITARPLAPEHGRLRDALSSIHAIFAIVRETLKQAGPAVARGPMSLGGFSLRLLDEQLAPFLAEWHPRLEDWECKRPEQVGPSEHERAWPEQAALRDQLELRRQAVAGYIEALAILAGLDESES